MVVDHRTYTLKPGMVGKWLKKFEADGLPLQEKHLGTLLGFFTTECGNLHQVVFMWRYESMADREERRAALDANPDWQQFISEVWDMDAIQSQEIKFLKPVSFSPVQ